MNERQTCLYVGNPRLYNPSRWKEVWVVKGHLYDIVLEKNPEKDIYEVKVYTNLGIGYFEYDSVEDIFKDWLPFTGDVSGLPYEDWTLFYEDE